MKWVYLSIVLVSLVWLPHSYQRNINLGYDFRIFYEAGKGNFDYQADGKGWLYSNYVSYLFKPLSVLRYDIAFILWYGFNVSLWLLLIRRLDKLLPRIWVITLSVISLYPMLLILELGQITPLLAFLCLSPLGSILGFFIKPYCIVFLCIHFFLAYRERECDRSNNKKSQYHIHCTNNNCG